VPVTEDEQAQKRPLFPKRIGLDPGSHFATAFIPKPIFYTGQTRSA
jgi:hypothetical protein